MTPSGNRTPASKTPPAWQRAGAWMQRNLFSSAFNSILTLVSLAAIYLVLVPLFNWLMVDAQWSGSTPAACPDKEAACWPFILVHFNQFLYGLYPRAEQWRIDLGVALGVIITAPVFMPKFAYKTWLISVLPILYALIAVLLFLGGFFGLVYVETSKWGGFFLTLVTAIFVLSTALPIAVALALGRESRLPLIRITTATWVEFWRSIPALVVLFVAIIMFPLFMPKGVEIDKLLRALIALTVLMSTYMAESIRGAIQAIPKDQYEAASALGFGYWQKTFLVILPQATPTALPQITSNFIGLFKETTILLIIGLYDLLGMVQNASSDPEWLSTGVSATGYLFVAGFFWLCCFSLSRYSAHLERKARVPQQGH